MYNTVLPAFCRMAVIALCLLLPAAAGAIEVQGLYEAEVPVAGQQRTLRRDAIRRAFDEVLVRVTGSSVITQHPGIDALRSRTVEFVQQYRYLTEKAVLADGSMGETLLLWVRFEPGSVNKALRAAQVPVWGRARPATLIWLALEWEGQRLLLDANTLTAIRTRLETRAAQRGLPVILPLMDLEDRAGLTFTDVWGNFRESIQEASQRYGTEAVLAGRVYQSGLFWVGHWTLYHGKTPVNWESRDTLDSVLNAGIDGSADTLAARFVQLPGDVRNTLSIRVNGILSLVDYARTLRFLRDLEPVTGVQVTGLDDMGVTFMLTTRGGQSEFVQVLALSSDTLIAPVSSAARTAYGPAADLTYRLLR